MNNQLDRYFVVGTDTGVGKTVLSLLMMQFFYAGGLRPFYIKPFQTGCRDPYDKDSDAKLIYQNVERLKQQDPADSVIYCFRHPKAPYFAARDEGKDADIDFGVVENFVQSKARTFSPLIIEGAGGLLVPVSEQMLMIDLIELTASKPIVAARAGLGTINHTLLTLNCLKARGLKPLGVVLIDSDKVPTSPDMIAENIEAIEKISDVCVAGVVGRIDDFSNPPKKCDQVLDRLF